MPCLQCSCGVLPTNTGIHTHTPNTHTHTHTLTCMQAHTHARTHTHMHAGAHTCTHTHAPSYSKAEGLDPTSNEMQSFTFLIVSLSDHAHYKDTHQVIAKVEGFSRLALNKREIPPVKIVLEERILILVRNIDSRTLGCSTPIT